MRRLSLDYETRSKVDLKLAGAYVYARDPSTRVLCAAYSIDDGPAQVWPTAAGLPMPSDLAAALAEPLCEIHAWNAQFERLITQHVVGVQVDPKRYRCTAFWARARGLPGKLEVALEVINSPVQMAHKRDGHRIMLKWCRPLPDGGWASDGEEYMRLLLYCMDDVRSEQRLQAYLHDTPLLPEEQADFDLGERINDNALPIDVPLALAAQAYGATEKLELNARLSELTGGTISTTGQHARVKDWLRNALGPDLFREHFYKVVKLTPKQERDVPTKGLVRVLEDAGILVEDPDSKHPVYLKPSTDKRARGDFLLSSDARELPDVVDVIALVDDAGKASVAKYATMAARAAGTGRAEGSYLTYGAAQTKRYSSRGVQAHNFPREGPEDLEGAVQAVMGGTLQGKVMHVLASLLRPTIKAPAGRMLVWGDWSSVEARAMPWLANEQPKLDLYRAGIDVYRVNAQDIFHVPAADASDDQRQIGKVAELSLQFGGAVGALKAMARNYEIGLADDIALRIITRWRDANRWASRFSYALYDAYTRAAWAKDRPRCVVHGVSYQRLGGGRGDTVVCTLPGGTQMYYPGNHGELKPEKPKMTKRLRSEQEQLTPIMFQAQQRHGGDKRHPNLANPRTVTRRLLSSYTGPTHKDVQLATPKPELEYIKAAAAHYRIEAVWHGLLAENVTQGLCAALLRDCLRRVQEAIDKARRDVLIVGHTHDEIILEAAEGQAKWARTMLAREMRRVPEWLEGFPLDCEVKSGLRYVKQAQKSPGAVNPRAFVP